MCLENDVIHLKIHPRCFKPGERQRYWATSPREHFVMPFLISMSVSFTRLPYVWGKEPSSIYVCIPRVQHEIDVQLILVNWMNVCAGGSEKLLKTAGLPRLLLMSGRLYLNSYLHNSHPFWNNCFQGLPYEKKIKTWTSFPGIHLPQQSFNCCWLIRWDFLIVFKSPIYCWP